MKNKFYKKKLKNGLTILFEKRDVPVVSTSLGIKQGFAYETEKEKGISHFFEHLVFKGTKNRTTKEIGEAVEKKGGVLNAFTDEEVTAFWNKMPREHFSIGFDIVSDLIINPLFKEKDFEREKLVILEELKMYKDNPSHYVLDKIKSLLYEKPFGISGIGTFDSLKNMKREDLVEYYKKNFRVNKMVLSVVGDLSFEDIEKMANNLSKEGIKSSKQKSIKPKKINKKFVEKRKGIDQASLAIGIHVPPLSNDKRYCWDIFDAVFASGMSSRLFEEVREKRGLAYSVRSHFDRGKDYGYYVIYVGTTKDKVKKCKEIILKEFKKMSQLSEKEFKEAKEQLIGLRKVGSEESVNVMNCLMHEEVAKDAKDFYKYEDKIRKVKLEDVRKLGKIKDYSSIELLPE